MSWLSSLVLHFIYIMYWYNSNDVWKRHIRLGRIAINMGDDVLIWSYFIIFQNVFHFRKIYRLSDLYFLWQITEMETFIRSHFWYLFVILYYVSRAFVKNTFFLFRYCGEQFKNIYNIRIDTHIRRMAG